MAYIKDRMVYKCVMFVKKIMEDGKVDYDKAFSIATNYYKELSEEQRADVDKHCTIVMKEWKLKAEAKEEKEPTDIGESDIDVFGF